MTIHLLFCDDDAKEDPEERPRPTGVFGMLHRLLEFIHSLREHCLGDNPFERKVAKADDPDRTIISPEDQAELAEGGSLGDNVFEAKDNHTTNGTAPAATDAPIEITKLPSAQSTGDAVHDQITAPATIEAPVETPKSLSDDIHGQVAAQLNAPVETPKLRSEDVPTSVAAATVNPALSSVASSAAPPAVAPASLAA